MISQNLNKRYVLSREFREKRLGIELVKDSVELSLQTELEIIKHHQDVFKQILKEVDVFLRIYYLEYLKFVLKHFIKKCIA